MAITGTTPRCKDAWLPWTPSQSLKNVIHLIHCTHIHCPKESASLGPSFEFGKHEELLVCIWDRDPHLDSSLMLTPPADGLGVIAQSTLLCAGPHAHHVVITTTGQVSPVRRPCQAAHLLGVSAQRGNVVVLHSDIVMVDLS